MLGNFWGMQKSYRTEKKKKKENPIIPLCCQNLILSFAQKFN